MKNRWWGRWDLNPGSHTPQACILNQARRRPHETGLGYKNEQDIIKTLLKMQSIGINENSIKTVSYQLKYLNANVDINQPEEVKTFIAQMKQANSYKQAMVKAYNYYAITQGIQWIRPIYKYERKIPLIPTNENTKKIIASTSKKYATIFTILEETGLEGHELSTIHQNNIDKQQGIINAQGCKGHKSRSFKLKPETAEMLRQYLNKYTNEKPFPDAMYMGKIWRRTRNNLAKKLQQPELKKIPLRNLRHKFATTTYDKTKDMFFTMQQMGHSKYETTLFYAQLIHFDNQEEYTVKVASNIQEATELIEHGFQLVDTMDGLKIYKKRK
jgi:integrase